MNFRKLFPFLLVLLSLSLSFTACDDDDDNNDDTPDVENNLRVVFTPIVNNETLAFDTEYTVDNYRILLNEFKTYFSEIALMNTEGEAQSLADVVLVSFANDLPEGQITEFETNVPADTYNALHIGLGLNETLNESYPTDYADTHPLSASQGAWWAWQSGYRHLQLEGNASADLNSTGFNNLEETLLYHIGSDNLFNAIDIDLTATDINNQNQTTLRINLNLNEILQGINVPVDKYTQTMDNMPLAVTIADNFANGGVGADFEN